MFRYRLQTPDGDDLGEATHAVMIKPGEEIHLAWRPGAFASSMSSLSGRRTSRRSWGCYRSRRPRPLGRRRHLPGSRRRAAPECRARRSDSEGGPVQEDLAVDDATRAAGVFLHCGESQCLAAGRLGFAAPPYAQRQKAKRLAPFRTTPLRQ
jgi:hypothetical protein